MTKWLVLTLAVSLSVATHTFAQHIDTAWSARYGAPGSGAATRGLAVDI